MRRTLTALTLVLAVGASACGGAKKNTAQNVKLAPGAPGFVTFSLLNAAECVIPGQGTSPFQPGNEVVEITKGWIAASFMKGITCS